MWGGLIGTQLGMGVTYFGLDPWKGADTKMCHWVQRLGWWGRVLCWWGMGAAFPHCAAPHSCFQDGLLRSTMLLLKASLKHYYRLKKKFSFISQSCWQDWVYSVSNPVCVTQNITSGGSAASQSLHAAALYLRLPSDTDTSRAGSASWLTA